MGSHRFRARRSLLPARLLIALLAVAAFAGGATLGPSAASAASAILSVFVTNDTAHPVPVTAQGTTTVGGTVNVGGTVRTVPGTPATEFSYSNRELALDTSPEVTGPDTTRRYAITNVVGSNQSTGYGTFAVVSAGTDSDCASADFHHEFIWQWVTVPPQDTVSVSLSQPFVTPVPSAGSMSCLFVLNEGGTAPELSVTIIGYKVP